MEMHGNPQPKAQQCRVTHQYLGDNSDYLIPLLTTMPDKQDSKGKLCYMLTLVRK